MSNKLKQNIQMLQEYYTDGFSMEKLRKKLLKLKKRKKLLATYSKKYPQIKDENSSKFWDKKLTNEENLIHPMEKDRIRIVAKLIKKGDNVLNLGIGKGELENYLYTKFSNTISWTGTDITENWFKKLKKNFPKWKFRKTKLTKLPFKTNLFDTIYLLEVLEHIQPDKTFKVLYEIKRVLKKNGLFIISVPINEGLESMFPKNPNAHVRIYSKNLIEFELKEVGFKIKKIHKLTAFSKFYHIKKLINNILKIKHSNNLIIIAKKT